MEKRKPSFFCGNFFPWKFDGPAALSNKMNPFFSQKKAHAVWFVNVMSLSTSSFKRLLLRPINWAAAAHFTCSWEKVTAENDSGGKK